MWSYFLINYFLMSHFTGCQFWSSYWSLATCLISKTLQIATTDFTTFTTVTPSWKRNSPLTTNAGKKKSLKLSKSVTFALVSKKSPWCPANAYEKSSNYLFPDKEIVMTDPAVCAVSNHYKERVNCKESKKQTYRRWVCFCRFCCLLGF